MMKKVFAMLLVAALLVQVCPVSRAAAEPVIRASQAVGAAGETVSVDIALENNPGLVAMTLDVVFDDTVLTLKEVQDKNVLGTNTHKPEMVNPYTLRWANNTVTENFTVNGTIATLVFEIAEDAAEGTYPVTISYNYDDFYIMDWQMQPVYFAVESGAVKVGEPEPDELSVFTYELSGNEMTITGYIGENATVRIGSTYTVDGTEYTVTAIGEESFSENTVVENISIPATVAQIGDYAFYLCENLKSVTMAEGVQSIGADAFEGCAALTKMVIPASVQTVGEYAFYDCTALTQIVLLNPDAQIGDVALGYYYISRREDGLVEDLVLEGHTGSSLQEYADAEGISFKPLLRFAGASVSLQNSLAMNYKVDAALMDAYGFTDPRVELEMNGKTQSIKPAGKDNGKYVFSFRGIAPNQINDTISATLYATFDGTEYATEVKEYSVATYCYNMLAKCSADSYAELRTLLVDLLNYGAASQTYTDYNTGALANANLTAAQLAWGTAEDRQLQNVLNPEYEKVDNPTVQWLGAGLNLQDAVTVRVKFAAASVEGVTLKIVAAGETYTVPASSFVQTAEGYYAYFNGLHAGQMSQTIYMTFYSGGIAISDTASYSIESYAFEQMTSEDANLVALLKAMMRYGDSAYVYAN